MAEIIKCPKCEKPLQIPENFFGQTVQCPECRHQFTAGSMAVSAQPVPAPASPAPPYETPASKPGTYDDDPRDDDRSRPRRGRYDDDGYDDLERPSRIHKQMVPHRGGTIIALGIVSLAVPCVGLICGPMAWVMGNTDLAEMRAGRMDSSGEGMVQAGRILGMIYSVLFVLGMIFYCLVFGVAMMGNR